MKFIVIVASFLFGAVLSQSDATCTDNSQQQVQQGQRGGFQGSRSSGLQLNGNGATHTGHTETDGCQNTQNCGSQRQGGLQFQGGASQGNRQGGRKGNNADSANCANQDTQVPL